ncbi:kinase-like domain-containing protein, partial [Blastocladiella britannica]
LLRPADHRGSLDRVTVALDAIEANIEYLVASPLDDAVPSSPAASLVTVDSETVRSSIAAAALAAASEPGMAIGAKNGRRIVRATWHTGVPVAIKRLETLSDMSDPIMVDDVKREAEVWSSLQPHPNLTPLLAICIDTDIPVLVMPYMTNGNVASYAQLHPTKRHGLIADAARGMAYLHALGIFHGDLKPSNVLVDGQGCARVSDLGLARMHASVRSSAVATGVRWIAPERLRAGAKFRLEPDVFAFAMVVFEVPFDEVQDPRVIRGMMADGERPSLDLVVQDHWRTLISRCWAHEPRLRPTFQTICDELDQFQSIQPSS